ncbi:MAG: GPR endopeptidase [Clostridiales bacterium]|jgi:spore protease|nr:GPR endopeptidase [Clostridiales bacterium]
MYQFLCRTDLADESHESFIKNSQSKECDGVNIEKTSNGDINISRVEVTTEQGAQNIGKPIGKYITIDINPNASDRSQNIEAVAQQLKTELRNILPNSLNAPIMVVGLGNWNITPDSLGPKVVDQVYVTRHLFKLMPNDVPDGVKSICALTPGVLGITGIETAEIVKSVVQEVKPAVVVAIDSLASRKLQRVSTTIQLSNTGINPGSGIGNNRNAVSAETLGVPVIAIGVPTVVDAATLAGDCIDMIIEKEKLEWNLDDDKRDILEQVLAPTVLGNVVVTPKEVDTMIEDLSEMIANGINYAFHEDKVFE